MTAKELNAIREKLASGIALTLDDGMALYQHANLLDVGQLANQVREKMHGDNT